MNVSVTTLGSRKGDAAGAASKVVKYLEGRGSADRGRDPGPSPEVPGIDATSGLTDYYADSMASLGIWMGRGLTGVRMDGLVDPDHLHRVLVGQNPHTADQLVTANGSAQRAHPHTATLRGPDDELLTLAQAADALGVSSSYLRAQAKATVRARAVQACQEDEGQTVTPLPPSHLDATRAAKGSAWQVTRAEARRFASEREVPPVVVGYDLTFSVPKSVSILWATATPAHQVAIEAAVTDAVRVAMAYLEAHAAHVRVSVRIPTARATTSNAGTPPGWWPPPTSTTRGGPSTPSSTSTSWWPTWQRDPTPRCARSTGGRSTCTPARPATWPPPNCATAWPWSSAWSGNRCTGASPTSKVSAAGPSSR